MGGQVVNFIRLVLLDQIHQRALIVQVALDDLDIVLQMLDALEGQGAGTPHHADDTIVLGEQQLGQVRAVLAGNSGNQCGGQYVLLLNGAEETANLREFLLITRRDKSIYFA